MLAASFLFATGGLVLKFIDWNPLAINGIRSFFGALVLIAFMIITHRKLRWNRTIFSGALAYMAMTTLFTMANKMTTAANAIVLQFTCPIWIILFAWLFQHQRPKAREWAALAAVLFGIGCFFFDSLSAGGMLGNLVAVFSGICYALMFMQNSLKDGDALSSVLYGQIFSFVLMGPMAFFESDFTPPALLALVWLGAMQVGLAYVFFCLGTAKIRPFEACLVTGLEPILNPLLVALFWHENLSPLALAGAVIVIVSITLFSLSGSLASTGKPAVQTDS